MVGRGGRADGGGHRDQIYALPVQQEEQDPQRAAHRQRPGHLGLLRRPHLLLHQQGRKAALLPPRQALLLRQRREEAVHPRRTRAAGTPLPLRQEQPRLLAPPPLPALQTGPSFHRGKGAGAGSPKGAAGQDREVLPRLRTQEVGLQADGEPGPQVLAGAAAEHGARGPQDRSQHAVDAEDPHDRRPIAEARRGRAGHRVFPTH